MNEHEGYSGDSCDSSPLICPICGWNSLRSGSPFSFSASLMRCRNCNEPLRPFKCTGTASKFHVRCLPSSENARARKNIKPQVGFSRIHQQIRNDKLIYIGILISLSVACFLYCISSPESFVTLMTHLKTDYPTQKNETWFHLLSVLDQKIPSVKAITFLHGEDKKTTNCLTNAIVSLYTGNSKIKMEEVTFSVIGSEARDYGFFLEHYRTVVKKFKVLVTDLSKVSGDIARIFHSLCDEVSSDLKPSLFIFTLKCDKKTASLKPLERATTTLKEAWRTLPQNEIFPLLSRIIKNVVDVVPEEHNNC